MPVRTIDPTESPMLFESGLRLRGVLAVPTLPEPVRAALRAQDPALLDYAQLLLFAHAGPQLWRSLRKAEPELGTAPDPVDTFSVAAVRAHLEQELRVSRWALLYPGTHPLPLQQLGALVGFHHESPLRVGINATFGTWFAYRVALVADTSLAVTPAVPGNSATDDRTASPCATCADKPCLDACLGSALTTGTLALSRCVAFRATEASPCALRCPAREACPVGAEHRYDDDQIRYHYGVSLRMIHGSSR